MVERGNGLTTYLPGTLVKIISSDFKGVIGMAARICTYQDCPGKIRVSFSDKFQGYFTPEQLTEVKSINDLIKR